MDLYSARIKEVRTDYHKDALSTICQDLRETFKIAYRLPGQGRIKISLRHVSEVSLDERFVHFFCVKIKSTRGGVHENLLTIPFDELNEGTVIVQGVKVFFLLK